MGLENEFGIDEKKAAAIVEHFRQADLRFVDDFEALTPAVQGYLDQFGRINFAALEQIFRQNKFNSYFLAIPSEIIEANNPDLIIADINDVYFDKKVTPRPFSAVAYPSFERVKSAAWNHGFVYESEKNLKRLKRAGGSIWRRGYTGDVRNIFITRRPPPPAVFKKPFSPN